MYFEAERVLTAASHPKRYASIRHKEFMGCVWTKEGKEQKGGLFHFFSISFLNISFTAAPAICTLTKYFNDLCKYVFTPLILPSTPSTRTRHTHTCTHTCTHNTHTHTYTYTLNHVTVGRFIIWCRSAAIQPFQRFTHSSSYSQNT